MEKISLVVSAFNEEQGIEDFHKEADRILSDYVKTEEGSGYTYDFWFVNDGSRDSTGELLKKLRNENPETVKIIEFSRNFGHEAAMCAGLDHADGDYLIFMDADLQHPPMLVPEIMRKFREGAEVISMVRTENEDAGKWKNITSGMFYSLINKMSTMHMEPSASDFFALSKEPADVLRNSFREKIRFIRGYVQNIGFNKATVSYEAARRVAGESHYSFKKLFKLSMDTIVCFSDMPLKFGFVAGVITGVAALIVLIVTLIGGSLKGTAAVITVMLFLFAVLFMLIGITGRYLSAMLAEIKDRPIYIIKDIEK